MGTPAIYGDCNRVTKVLNRSRGSRAEAVRGPLLFESYLKSELARSPGERSVRFEHDSLAGALLRIGIRLKRRGASMSFRTWGPFGFLNNADTGGRYEQSGPIPDRIPRIY